MKTKFNFADLIAFLMLLCVAIGCGTSNMNDRTNSVSKTRSSTDAATVSIEAKQLAREFADNEVRADHLYAGKTMSISGTVETVETIDGNISLIFQTGGLNKSLSCRFSSANTDELAQIRRGQDVTATGVVLGLDSQKITVILDDCSTR